MDTNAAVQQAIQKTNSGDLKSAQVILANVLSQEPRNARAWYLLSQIISDRNREIDCLKKVLEIEPNSQQAKTRLQKLLQVNPPIQPVPVALKAQPVDKKKNTLNLWTCLIVIFVGTGILFAAIFFYIKNAPDATQCVQLENNFCTVGHSQGNTLITGFIVNTCDKPITNINLHGQVISSFDNSILGDVTELQDIVIAPGQDAFFQLIDRNTYFGDYANCNINTNSAYFVK